MFMRKSHVKIIILFLFVFITGCGQEKQDKNQETVQIEDSTYTKAQIQMHLTEMYRSRPPERFMLWSKVDEPFNCVASIHAPPLLEEFNKTYKYVSRYSDMDFPSCYHWSNKERKYQIVFLYLHDFTDINTAVNIEDMVGKKIPQMTIQILNSIDNLPIKYERYKQEDESDIRTFLSSILIKYPDSKNVDDWIHSFYEASYLVVSGGLHSNVIKESILHPESDRIDLSEMDKLVLKFSYEISSGKTVYTTKEAIDLIANRVFYVLSNK
jgi:hypothetical protein